MSAKRIVSRLNTLKFLAQHPLGRQQPRATALRFVRWQIASRIGLGPSIVPFVEDAHLVVSRGMTGATGNIYVGLHEYEEMSFVLHLLRPEDLFADIGANVGTYTILASKVIGAHTISVEPVPTTFVHLENNIFYNRVGSLVEAHNVGMSNVRGQLRFSADLDTMNHIVDASYTGQTVLVDVSSLDELLEGRVPLVMKIDVEGFERDVLAGATETLVSPKLRAIVMEVDAGRDRSVRLGKTAFDTLRDAGFDSYRYQADKRVLTPSVEPSDCGNYLFIRDVATVRERLRSARTFRVGPWRV
ncbi:MAG TPA: FkbM family methyltransferase [Polyangium sp.]|nr:FkbM family methyltransferase [Polyangium sp.]